MMFDLGLKLLLGFGKKYIVISLRKKNCALAKKAHSAFFRQKCAPFHGGHVIGHEISSGMGLKPSNLPGVARKQHTKKAGVGRQRHRRQESRVWEAGGSAPPQSCSTQEGSGITVFQVALCYRNLRNHFATTIKEEKTPNTFDDLDHFDYY